MTRRPLSIVSHAAALLFACLGAVAPAVQATAQTPQPFEFGWAQPPVTAPHVGTGQPLSWFDSKNLSLKDAMELYPETFFSNAGPNIVDRGQNPIIVLVESRFEGRGLITTYTVSGLGSTFDWRGDVFRNAVVRQACDPRQGVRAILEQGGIMDNRIKTEYDRPIATVLVGIDDC